MRMAHGQADPPRDGDGFANSDRSPTATDGQQRPIDKSDRPTRATNLPTATGVKENAEFGIPYRLQRHLTLSSDSFCCFSSEMSFHWFLLSLACVGGSLRFILGLWVEVFLFVVAEFDRPFVVCSGVGSCCCGIVVTLSVSIVSMSDQGQVAEAAAVVVEAVVVLAAADGHLALLAKAGKGKQAGKGKVKAALLPVEETEAKICQWREGRRCWRIPCGASWMSSRGCFSNRTEL